MKKVLFTILGLSFLALNAQVAEKITTDYPQFKIVVKNESNNNNNSKREVGGGWFNYAGAYNDFNASNLSSSVNFIQPDTNLHSISTDGTKRSTPFHIIGRINDPRDEVFGNNPARFSKFNSYTWDSIRFTQFYVRFADSMMKGSEMVEIVDTAYIQYFLPSGLEQIPYIYQNEPNTTYYASFPRRSSFNWRTKMNTAAFKTDTVFLTKEFADSVALDGENTTFFGRRLVAPVGANITANMNNLQASLVGHTITFKPMKKPANGDTGIAYNGATWSKKYNMYGLRLLSQTGVEVENTNAEAVNNSVICNFQVGYGGLAGNFWRAYLPGTVFSRTLFDGTEYHLTTQTLSVKNVDALGNGIGNVYPNPNNGNNEVFVPVKLADAKVVTLTIRDITGKVVKTISNEYNAGDFDITVSTADLNKGVYTCTMTTDNYTGTTKFILN